MVTSQQWLIAIVLIAQTILILSTNTYQLIHGTCTSRGMTPLPAPYHPSPAGNFDHALAGVNDLYLEKLSRVEHSKACMPKLLFAPLC